MHAGRAGVASGAHGDGGGGAGGGARGGEGGGGARGGGATDTGAETENEGGRAGTSGAGPSGGAMVPSGPEADAEDMQEMDLAEQASEAEVMANIESALTPVQRYMMRFLEETGYLRTEAEEAALAFSTEKWELDELQRRKEEEEALADEDDEVLFYEMPVQNAAQTMTPLQTGVSGGKGSGRGRKRGSSIGTMGTGGALSGSETDGGGGKGLAQVSTYLMKAQGALGGYDTNELQTLEVSLWGPPQPPGRDGDEQYAGGEGGGAEEEDDDFAMKLDGTVSTLEFSGLITEGARGVQRVRAAISERKRQARDSDTEKQAKEAVLARQRAEEARGPGPRGRSPGLKPPPRPSGPGLRTPDPAPGPPGQGAQRRRRILYYYDY